VLANRKKGFHESRLPKNEEIGSIFVVRGSEVKTLNSFQKFKIKIKKSKKL
jgi:hypothetical protein